MVKSRNNLKFLSQSVLLEEAGLPRINSFIILVVFAMVVAFIAWSLNMKIDEVVTVDGIVIQETNTGATFAIRAQIPTKEIATINEGFSAVVNISGITGKSPIIGAVGQIEKTPKTSDLGIVYYEAPILPSNEKAVSSIENYLMPGMTANIKIVIGSRSLFQYFLGPVLSAKENAFKEK